MKYSNVLVFIGFLTSSSILINKEAPGPILEMVPHYFWMATLFASIFLYLIGYSIYFFSRNCSFLLQICQYLILPVCGFCSFQMINFSSDISKPQNMAQIIKTLTLYGILLALTTLKIFTINQCFPGQEQKQILQFQMTTRIFRLIKPSLNCISIIVLAKNQVQIIIIILNIVDFLLVYRFFTYIKIQLQQTLLLASLNNLLSICVFELLKQSQCKYLMLSEIFLFTLFILQANPLHYIMQLKILVRLQQLKIGRNYFQKQESKSLIILLLSCYSAIFRFQDQEDRLIVGNRGMGKWSEGFVQKIKNTYQLVLKFYLSQISYFHMLSNQQQIELKSKSTVEIQRQLDEMYEQSFDKKKSIPQIVQDKYLFYNLVAFCINSFVNKDSKALPWSYSDQFFLSLTPKMNQNFIMKMNLYIFQRLAFTDQPITYKCRNQKMQQYIKFYKQSFHMLEGPEQKYMRFQNKLSEFKKKLQQICLEEVKIVQKFGNAVASLNFQDLLQKRQEGKNKIFKLIDQCFEFGQYLYFQQFTYLYLLFNIVFCKSIYQTSHQIRQKFMINFNKSDNLSQNSLNDTSIIVCCGLDKGNDKFGQIMMANSHFRRGFGISNNEIQHKQRRISDLIVGNKQKLKHLQLMQESSTFSQNILKQSVHSDYKCILKKNLGYSNINILGQFRVQTSIFHSYFENLLYLCKLQPINHHNFMIKSEHHKISKRRLTFHQNIFRNQQQLNQKMELLIIDNIQIQSLPLIRQTNDVNTLDSLDLIHTLQNQRNILDEQQKKFCKMENVLWRKDTFGDKKLIKNICLTALFLFLICASSISIFVFCRYLTHSSKQIQKQLQSIIVKTQAIPIHVSFYLLLKNQIDNNQLNSAICSPSYFDDLYTFSIERSNYWVSPQVNEYFANYQQSQTIIIPILGQSFWNSINPSYSEFSNYLYTTSSMVSEYLNTNLSLICQKQKDQFTKFIQQKMSQNTDSLSNKLLNKIIDLGNNELFGSILQIKTLYIAATIVIAVSIFLLFFFLLKVYAEYLQYFELLMKTGEEFLYKRAHQMKFIIKQIQNIKDFNGTKCQILSSFQVSFQTQKPEKQQYILNLNQFQKLVQPDEGKVIFEVSNFNAKQTFISILLSKKNLLIVLLLCCGLLITMGVLIGQASTNVVSNSVVYCNILKQGEITRESYIYLLISNWVGMQSDRSNFVSDEKFRQVNGFLQQKELVDLLISNLDSKQLDLTLNKDLCSLLDEKNLNKTSKQQCMKNLNSFSSLGISQLMTIIEKNQYSMWKKDDMNRISALNQQKLCEDMRNVLFYLEPAIIAIWSILRQILSSKTIQLISVYSAVLWAGTACFLILMIRQLWKTYYSLTCIVKFEVFTLDTPSDLYKYPYFKPYLNKMLYHQFQGSIQ